MEFVVRFILCEAMLNFSGREKQGSAFCPKWYDISDSALILIMIMSHFGKTILVFCN